MTRVGPVGRERWAGVSATRAAPTVLAAVAVAGVALSVLATVVIGALGPSAAVPPLPGPGWQPPYSLSLKPGDHLVIAMEALAVLLGAAGLAAGLLALRRGWAPDPRLLLLGGCLAAVVLAFLPPSGSADHLNYAAYGRMAVLGHDPYAMGADTMPGDPLAAAVERPWQEEPSVYGPVATAVQALAALAGGGSVRLTVFALAAVNAAAFVVTAWLLHRTVRGDRARQARAALLWAANPLVIYQLVAGMHVDTLAIALVVAALAAGASGRRWASGPLLGLGIAVKANAGLVALGPAWALRSRPRSLAVVAGTATATVLVAYALAGPHALDPVLHATKSISLASPWHVVLGGLQATFGSGGYRVWIQVGSVALLVFLALTLSRALREPYGLTTGLLPRTPGARDRPQQTASREDDGGPLQRAVEAGNGDEPLRRVAGGGDEDGSLSRVAGVEADGGSLRQVVEAGDGGGSLRRVAGVGDEDGSLSRVAGVEADGGSLRRVGDAGGGGGAPGAWGVETRAVWREEAGVAVVVVAAWLFATPYALPWYDGLGFALLAAVPATFLDGFLVARLAVLSAAYLPARQEYQPQDLHDLLVTVLRSQVVPWILLALTVALAWWALTSGARGSTRRGSAAPPP